LQKRLGVTVGIIGSYRGGTWNENWMTPESIKQIPELSYLFEKYDKEFGVFEDEAAYEAAYQQYLVDMEDWKQKGGWSHGMVPFAPTGPKAYQRPAGLYECMIKPLQPYTIKGVIWYQGEGNSGRYEEFRTLFPAFVEGWRKTWGQPDLPFYFVQLPPFKAASWPHFRQAQLDCAQQIPNCGMVVSEGCGDFEDIHPKVKKPIGDRLAIAVSSEVYGQQHLPYGPVFESVEFRDGKAGLRFRYAQGGLELSAEPDGAFEIAGADKVFVTADVELKGPALLLWNDAVKHPAYVRYAYSPYPNMVLFNQEGLPASPFTTERSD
jgi:sialate O-acetylesterase